MMRTHITKTFFIGSVFGVCIYVDIMIVPAILILYALGGIGLFLIALPAFIVHEIAHIIIAKLIRCPISHITLMPFGVSIFIENTMANDTVQLLALHTAGPFANITLYSLFYALGTHSSSLLFLQIAYVNGILSIISLLPIIPLDGSNILRTLLRIKLNERTALNLLTAISITICSAVIVFCIYIYVVHGEFLWQIIAISLIFFTSVIKERFTSAANSISAIVNKSRLIKQKVPLTESKHYVHHSASILSVLRSAQHNNFNVYIITNDNFDILAELTEQQLLDAALLYGNETPISEAFELLN